MAGARLVLVLLFICSLLNASCLSSASQLAVATQEVNSFSENVLISTDDIDYEHHVEVSLVITDNGTIFAGWKNAHSHNGAGVRVSITKSVDGGATWTQPFNMPMFGAAETEQSDPWLAWHDGILYYAYLEVEVGYFDDPESGNYFTQMTVAKSTDYGDSWILVKATNATHFADKETFTVADDGTIYLVYDDVDVVDPLGNSTVRLSVSSDGGDSYRQTTVLSEDPGNLGPYVTTDRSGNVYVVWTWLSDEGGNLLFSKSTDGGLAFSDPVFINDDANSSAAMPFGGKAGKVTLPVLRFDQNERLYVLWDDMYDQEGDTFDVYLRYSDDFGETWSNRIRVNPVIEGHQWNPEMAIDDEGVLHFAYYDEFGGTYRPYYRTLNFTGSGRDGPDFTDAIPIADALTSSDFTRPGEYLGLRTDSSGKPHVAWSDGRNNEMDIYYAQGSSSAPTTTTSQPPDLAFVAVVIIVSVVVVVAVIVILRRKS